MDYESPTDRIASLIGDADPSGSIPTDEGYKGPKPKVEAPVADDETVDDTEADDAPADDQQEDEGVEESSDTEAPDDEGDADDDSTEDESEASALPSTLRVKVDGEEIEVTLDEARAGYQRHAAFTRKTQELAEEKKAVGASKQETAQLREQYVQGLEVVEKILADRFGDVDWPKLEKENPTKFASQWAAYQLHQRNLQVIGEELGKARDAASRERADSMSEHLKGEKEKLLAAIPEWEDDKGSKAERERLVAYAHESFGWTPDEISQIPDHRLIVMLRKSMLYDETTKAAGKIKDKAKAKVSNPPKLGTVEVPKGTAKDRDKAKRAQRNRDRLRKDGSNAAAEAVFRDMFQSEYPDD